MTLERQDVRGKIDADLHEALLAICEAKGITQAEFIESLVVPEIKRLIHEATVIADRVRHIPAAGNNRVFQGRPGKHRAPQGK